MSQKVNPIIFRRLKNFDCSSFQQQIYNGTYSPYVLNEHEQITRYSLNFMRHCDIVLHSLKMIKTCTGRYFVIIRYLSFTEQNKRLSFRLKFSRLERAFALGVSKILGEFQVSISFFDLSKEKEGLNLPLKFLNNWKFFSLSEIKNSMKLLLSERGNAFFLASYISFKLSELRSKVNKKSQGQFLIIIKSLISHICEYNKIGIKGIKIVIKGRINGIPRTKKWTLLEGTLSLQQINQDIDYFYLPSYTVHGAFGVKVWINYG